MATPELLPDPSKAKCPWCDTQKIVVVKGEMVYLPKHKAGMRNRECYGSGMPLRFKLPGEEPTDRWQQ